MKNAFLFFVSASMISSMAAQELSNAPVGEPRAVLSFANGPVVGSASVDSTKVYHLKEVVVSATRSERNPTDVGRSITLISKEQINNSIYNNVSELLSQQEGIYVVGTA